MNEVTLKFDVELKNVIIYIVFNFKITKLGITSGRTGNAADMNIFSLN